MDRCSEDAALELAIRDLLPAAAEATGAGPQVVQSPSTAVRQALQAGDPYAVHGFSDADVDVSFQGRPEATDYGADPQAAARSAQLARLSNLM